MNAKLRLSLIMLESVNDWAGAARCAIEEPDAS